MNIDSRINRLIYILKADSHWEWESTIDCVNPKKFENGKEYIVISYVFVICQ